MSSGARLCSANVRRCGDARVLAVGAVAPAVERAREAGRAGAAALDDLDAAVPARVLEGAHADVVGAHDDDRLVEDLVLGEVVGPAGSPRAGTPSARPGARAARLPLRRSRGRSSAPWEPGRGAPSRSAPAERLYRPVGTIARCNRSRPTSVAPPRSTYWSSARASPASISCTARGRRASPCVLLEAGDGVGRHLVLEPVPGRAVRLRELHLRVPLLA